MSAPLVSEEKGQVTVRRDRTQLTRHGQMVTAENTTRTGSSKGRDCRWQVDERLHAAAALKDPGHEPVPRRVHRQPPPSHLTERLQPLPDT